MEDLTRYDEHGFYGAAEPAEGRCLDNDNSLDPPELIIQDELHLISGPLGTVAGLYETAIDRLASRQYDSYRVRPKIVASTATVRRARAQIRALFDRDRTQVFPPPGIERTDSFFAHTLPSSDEHPARLYLGLAAQGRGPKLVFLRGLTTLMASAGTIFHDAGGVEARKNPADPYMTALGYFNALRELGGARRIVEDEVRDRLSRYASHLRVDPPDPAFEDRNIGDPMELTSRVSTDEVAEAKSRLESSFSDSEAKKVDVALATNMISVGLDISRLGLMVVQGQPKTAAEYIQATSRVGRQSDKPGLVVTVLNLHKPRDRTHYESFHLFHRTFYRAVEATSVTPWAARALDRSLAAVLVSIARHLRPEMTPERAVQAISETPEYGEELIEIFLGRAPDNAVVGGREALRTYLQGLLEDWQKVIDVLAPRLVYGDRKQAGSTLLHQPLDPQIPNLDPPEHRRFLAARSMRDVEANIVLRVRDPYGNPFNADDI
ncbi:MAG: helicase-related protein [Rhodospirillaceae bacterium]